jgi:acyl carrier protein
MTNVEKYKKAFIDSLSINKDLISKNLEYNSIPEWDSIGHMSLMSALEETFKINFETDDIIDFSSFEKGKEILKKYKVNI